MLTRGWSCPAGGRAFSYPDEHTARDVWHVLVKLSSTAFRLVDQGRQDLTWLQLPCREAGERDYGKQRDPRNPGKNDADRDAEPDSMQSPGAAKLSRDQPYQDSGDGPGHEPRRPIDEYESCREETERYCREGAYKPVAHGPILW